MATWRWTVLSAVLMTFTACSGGSNSADDDIPPTPTPLVDEDGDGYAAAEDCQDQDPAIHPDATEVCDQVDNNCDGKIDEGFPTETYYPDQDGDTYGTDQGALTTCVTLDGYATQGGDCDDSNADVHPGATEVECSGVDEDCSGMDDDHPDRDGDGYDVCAADVAGSDGLEADCDDTRGTTYPGAAESCDELDNDCDGDVDEDLVLNPYYLDADADQHGDPEMVTEGCSPPPGYVSVGDDCDDGDSTVFPGAPETYGDGIDSNCNGYSDYIVTVGDADDTIFSGPTGLAKVRQGNLFVADTGNHVVRQVDVLEGTVTTYVSSAGSSGLQDGEDALLDSPTALVFDTSGNTLYIADTGNNRIRAYDVRTGTVETVAGNGDTDYDPNSSYGFATDAHLYGPRGVAYTNAGFLVISDTGNDIVRKAGPFGTPDNSSPLIETIAGGGDSDYSSSQILATSASLHGPTGVVVDTTGTIYFSDTQNHVVAEIENNYIRVFAGQAGNSSLEDDGEDTLPTGATLNEPTALAMSLTKVLVICDTGNNRLRAVEVENGQRVIRTIAGSASLDPDLFVSEGEALDVPLAAPQGVAIAIDGTLWIADTGHNVVRKLIP